MYGSGLCRVLFGSGRLGLDLRPGFYGVEWSGPGWRGVGVVLTCRSIFRPRCPTPPSSSLPVRCRTASKTLFGLRHRGVDSMRSAACCPASTLVSLFCWCFSAGCTQPLKKYAGLFRKPWARACYLAHTAFFGFFFLYFRRTIVSVGNVGEVASSGKLLVLALVPEPAKLVRFEEVGLALCGRGTP